MLGGWVSLDRAMLDHWVSEEPELFAFWVRLIMEANFEDRKKMFNGTLVEIKRGQVIFGLDAFAAKTKITHKKLRRYLSMLEAEGMIGRQKTNKFSLISITNYDEYQKQGRQEAGKGQAEGKQRAGKGQHRNNVNNENNGNKEIMSPRADDAQSVFDYWCHRMSKGVQTKFSPKRRKAVQARIKEGRTVDELKQAIDGCASSPFHMGQGPKSDGTVYDDLELICRNNEKLESFMQLYEKPPGKQVAINGNSDTEYFKQKAKEDPFL